MKHKHHIIPKHIGGKKSPTVELTIAEHAEAHKKLYEQHGRWQDRIAWQGLSGMIGHEECIRQAIIESNKKRLADGTHNFLGKKISSYRAKNKTKEHREKIRIKKQQWWKTMNAQIYKEKQLPQIQEKGIVAMAKLRKGTHLSKEHRRNIGLGQQGHPAYPKQQQRASQLFQKTYTVIDPHGRQFTITNLRQFCLEHKLHQANMLYKKCGSKGWKAKLCQE